jgi:hypothetical protein
VLSHRMASIFFPQKYAPKHLLRQNHIPISVGGELIWKEYTWVGSKTPGLPLEASQKERAE